MATNAEVRKTIKDEAMNKLFDGKQSITITQETFPSFITKLEKVGKEVEESFHVKEERVAMGSNIKAEDLNNMARGVMVDIGWHLDHVDHIQATLNIYNKEMKETGKSAYNPAYNTQEKIDHYKVELGKLFHTLSIKLRMAILFGFGDTEGVISVVDTSKLPTPEEGKKIHRKQMLDALDKATRKTKDVDNKGTGIFKKQT